MIVGKFQKINTIREEALRLYDAGLLPVPCLPVDQSPTGDKHPAVKWSLYRGGERPDRQTVASWFVRLRGIACLGGRASAGLESLDFDNHSSVGGEFRTWTESIPRGLLSRLVLYTTPSDGFRASWRFGEGMGESKVVLARRSEKEVSVELLGSCLHYCPGGTPDAHPKRRPYAYLRGHLAELPVLTADERSLLLEAAARLSLWTPPVRPPSPRTESRRGRDWTASADFNRRATWEEILEPHGWERVGYGDYWRRPGKSVGVSATTADIDGRDVFYCFSSSAGFQQKGYEKWAVFAVLNFTTGGVTDFSAASKELARRGYGRANQMHKLNDDFVRRFRKGLNL